MIDALVKSSFPPYPNPLPQGGEGKTWNRFNALWLLNPATSPTPSPPASGGEGWGEGGRTTACNFLTGHYCLNPPFTKGDLNRSSLLPPLWERGDRGGFIAGGEQPLTHERLAPDNLSHLDVVDLEELPQGHPADAQEAGGLALFAPSLVNGVDQPLALVRGPP